MLRDSVVVVVVVVVSTRPRAIPLVMITMRKSTPGFPFLSHDDEYGAPFGGPKGRLSSAKKRRLQFTILIQHRSQMFCPYLDNTYKSYTENNLIQLRSFLVH